MKRLLWISFSIVLFLSGISKIKADTILEPVSNKNGNVEINLDFEEGYVGAIDLTLKVSSNVKVTGVNWDTSLSTSYTKRYTYDEINHVVKIYLATGNNTKNLVDKTGKLKVGNLTVKSANGETVNYTVEATSLSIVDANYASIAKTDLKIGGNNQFTYQVTNDNNPIEPEKPSTNKPNQSKPNQSTSNEDFIKDPTEEKNDVEESGDKDDTEDSKKDDDNKDDTNKKPTDKKPDDNKEPDQLEESKEGKSFDWKIMFGIVVIAMLLITLISMITKKFKD